MELSEVENAYIFHIMKMKAKVKECARFFFAAEFITLREPGTEFAWGQIPYFQM